MFCQKQILTVYNLLIIVKNMHHLSLLEIQQAIVVPLGPSSILLLSGAILEIRKSFSNLGHNNEFRSYIMFHMCRIIVLRWGLGGWARMSVINILFYPKLCKKNDGGKVQQNTF